jgi:NitT/TauT family transport system permease protein
MTYDVPPRDLSEPDPHQAGLPRARRSWVTKARRGAAATARNALWPLLGLIVILCLWQLILTWTNTHAYLVPKPSDVWTAVAHRPGLLWTSFWVTAEAAALGLLFAAIVGVCGAMILSLSPALERSIFPYAVVLQTTPVIAIAPLVVIWFGPSVKSIIVIVFLISLFPILSNTLVGLNAPDPDILAMFQLSRASRIKTMWKLRLPSALPYCAAGFKISAGLAVIGAIVAEYVAGIGGGRGGLGYLITVAASQLNTPYLVGGALAGSIMGLAFFGGVSFLWNLVLRWHQPGISAGIAPHRTEG